MNTRSLLAVVTLTASLSTLAVASDARTASGILSTPYTYENQPVTLDVAMVRPAHTQSPIPQLAFFHVMTIDRTDRKPAGEILVSVPAEQAEKFAKKYGTDFTRFESNALKGTLLASPGREGGQGKIWFVDMSGQAAELIQQKKLTLADDEGGKGPGNRPGFAHRGPGQRGNN